MISKYISRRISQLHLQSDYKTKYLQCLERVKKKYLVEGMEKSFIIKKICFKFLTICDNLLSARYLHQSLSMIEFIKEIMLQIYEGNSIEIYLIKIKTYLLTIKWYNLKSDDKAKDMFLNRIKLFIREIEECPFTENINKDYYSNIQRLYLHVIRRQIKQPRINEGQVYIAKCFEILKSQISVLNELMSYQQKKVYSNMEVKVKLLTSLFGLEHGYKLLQGELRPDQITEMIYPKYEKIINKIPVCVHKEVIIKKYEQIINVTFSTEVDFFSKSRKKVGFEAIPEQPAELKQIIQRQKKERLAHQKLKTLQNLQFINDINQKSTVFQKDPTKNALSIKCLDTRKELNEGKSVNQSVKFAKQSRFKESRFKELRIKQNTQKKKRVSSWNQLAYNVKKNQNCKIDMLRRMAEKTHSDLRNLNPFDLEKEKYGKSYSTDKSWQVTKKKQDIRLKRSTSMFANKMFICTQYPKIKI